MSASDQPIRNNPAYERAVRTHTGTDFVTVPVFDEEGDVISQENIYFEFEQYNSNMVVSNMSDYQAHPDDVHDTIKRDYRNYNVTFE